MKPVYWTIIGIVIFLLSLAGWRFQYFATNPLASAIVGMCVGALVVVLSLEKTLHARKWTRGLYKKPKE